MKHVYVIMDSFETLGENWGTNVLDNKVFSTKKKAIEYLMAELKGLIFTCEGEFYTFRPDEYSERTLWIEKWELH